MVRPDERWMMQLMAGEKRGRGERVEATNALMYCHFKGVSENELCPHYTHQKMRIESVHGGVNRNSIVHSAAGCLVAENITSGEQQWQKCIHGISLLRPMTRGNRY